MSQAGREPGEQPTLDALRAATGAAHRELDERLIFVRSPRREATVAYLAAFLAFLAPRERRVWAQPQLEDLDPRRRLAKARWLREDLERLGGMPVPEDDPGDLGPWPRALGVAYVLEGSTLGSQVLRRRPGLDTLRYLEGYGEATGPMWLALIERLEREGRDRAAREAIVDGAASTFDDLHSWLEVAGCMAPTRSDRAS
ncbi:biliverdin-producing heme oxygenase [Pseudenhygromyxa sp. WMMC2535]|uniref:biliverdin-producing heme oxygenase n=1 Tax=Pseudenhygromyxa sp. WMMC2535 TaxID=2712867 RepID=UPI0015546BC7|nr:biliverdin-producing heme oxygenase [Pseudenhygromyxa sp. WMMC2535]NVB43024.1 biliverdin-producing heme oxygenase [Pseudenhygromyxa sp. WMMC2535]